MKSCSGSFGTRPAFLREKIDSPRKIVAPSFLHRTKKHLCTAEVLVAVMGIHEVRQKVYESEMRETKAHPLTSRER